MPSDSCSKTPLRRCRTEKGAYSKKIHFQNRFIVHWGNALKFPYVGSVVLTVLTACAQVGPRATPPYHAPVVVKPTNIAKVNPQYPPMDVQLHHEGVVTTLLKIGPDGQVIDALIEKSSGYREMDAAALSSVKQWRFTPETYDGVPKIGYVRIPVNFSMPRPMSQQMLPSSLIDQYINAMRARILQSWLRPDGLVPGSRCALSVTQLPGGEITNAATTGSCQFDASARQSLVNAALRSRYLPYADFASVFQRVVVVDFIVPETL